MIKKLSLTFIAIVLYFFAKSQYSKDIVVEPILKTDTTSIGQKIIYPNFQNGEVSIVKVIIPPGKSTGWHKHDFPVFAYVLQGSLTVEIENKKTLQFKENTSFAEVINTFHNGTNNGDVDVVLMAIYMGEKGKDLSIRKSEIRN